MNKWQAPTDSNFKEESAKGFCYQYKENLAIFSGTAIIMGLFGAII